MEETAKAMFLVGFIIFLVACSIALLAIPSTPADANNITVNKIKEEPKVCEHEFVITSKYDWIFSAYKTISKCHKCGQEIE